MVGYISKDIYNVTIATAKLEETINAKFKDKRILFVEDSETLSNILYQFFNKQFRCYQAFNGVEALNLCSKYKFDVIILDINMPIMNGIEFLQKTEPGKNIIIHSANIDSNFNEINNSDIIFIGKTPYDIVLIEIAKKMNKSTIVVGEFLPLWFGLYSKKDLKFNNEVIKIYMDKDWSMV